MTVPVSITLPSSLTVARIWSIASLFIGKRSCSAIHHFGSFRFGNDGEEDAPGGRHRTH
jgi:hypothetical protein